MRADEMRFVFDYNYWANKRILDTAERAGEKVFAGAGELSHGGLRGTLVHLLSAEWIWRRRIQDGVSPKEMLSEKDFSTLADVRRRWAQEEEAMRRFLAALRDQDLDHMVTYQDRKGTPFAHPLWQLLLHMVNHGTQTRSEAAVHLTQQGFSPGEIDLRLYMTEAETK